MAVGQALSVLKDQRRALRWSQPEQQARLSLYVLALSVGFAGLFCLASYMAYGALFKAAVAMAPGQLEIAITEQTRYYGIVCGVLLVGYTLGVIGVTAAYVSRLLGPNVACTRHVRSLQAGDYAARVNLREGDAGHGELAHELNELAAKLERGRA